MKIVFGAVVILCLSSAVFAQQTIIGKYTGTFVTLTRSGDRAQGLTLEIASVEGDIVKGKATRYPSGQAGLGCQGEYPVEGTLKANELILKSTEKGGRAADCGMNLNLNVEGNKLVGTVNKNKAELSK